MDIFKKYWNSAYLIVLPLIPILCISAGLFWTVCKTLGYYPQVSWLSLILFDCSQFIYLIISFYIIIYNKKHPFFVSTYLFQVKCYIMAILVVQYLFILTLFPSFYTWECTILFLAATVFFFDTKLQIVNSAFCFSMLAISYALRPDAFFPERSSFYIQMLSFQTVILVLSILVLIVIVHLAETFLIQAQEHQEQNTRLLQKQLEYYKQLDLMDRELRRFRHDINNHFICINALLEQGKNEELAEYFKDLQKNLPSLKQLYYTGNAVTDVILNYELGHHCQDSVCVSVSGLLPSIESVSSMDICTVFSNMLTNAIHAVNACEDKSKQSLTIHFQYGKQFFSIAITNHSDCPLSLHTETANANRNHGHGLHIIREVIEKYDGSFEQTEDTNQITTTVILPL